VRGGGSLTIWQPEFRQPGGLVSEDSPVGAASSLFKGATLIDPFDSYFEYERAMARTAIIPWLTERLSFDDGLAVGDFGCHEGGTLQALRDGGLAASGTGFELESEVLARSPFVCSEHFDLRHEDILEIDPAEHRFDLILLIDVLEHVPALERALAVAAGCLGSGGRCFVSFPPYFSPLGGHQHVASNWTRLAPYLHYLPSRLFYAVVEVKDDPYLNRQELLADMRSVRRTKLTVARAERAFSSSGLQVVARDLFLLRPEYRARYGVRPVRAGVLGRVPGLREAVVMGAYYLLEKA
jgi:SAM-dependent methyltransferase